MSDTQYFVTGGAGFLGSCLVNSILDRKLGAVTVFDNFQVGRREHLERHSHNPDLRIVVGDVGDRDLVVKSLGRDDIVFHLAANSDIARAVSEPLIDFDNGTHLTQSLLEAMRIVGAKRILYTSGSGVYGEVPPVPIPEDYAFMKPISTYGASKLASEVLICAYCHMFDFVGTVFRFANVVGPNMTHGVSYDFTRRLHSDPTNLEILGDGHQTKPYIHAHDVVAAMLHLQRRQSEGYQYFNVASQDHLTVRQIADLIIEEMALKNVKLTFTGGNRGWRADVPVYSLDTSKVRATGWSNEMSSRQAVTAAVRSLIEEIAAGL